MGIYLNPGNEEFQKALNSKIYVDKTGLIEYTNSVLDTTDAYICNSRPRRFGKTIMANMINSFFQKIPDEAIAQIKDKKYALRFAPKIAGNREYTGRILAVGIFVV